MAEHCAKRKKKNCVFSKNSRKTVASGFHATAIDRRSNHKIAGDA
jgi:hypothetical protein